MRAVRAHVAESYHHVYQSLLCELSSKMRSPLTCLYVVVAAYFTFASVQGKGVGIDGGFKKEQ